MDIKGFNGLVVAPGDTDYDEGREIWNGVIDRRPAVIARCTGPRDVAAAIAFARERELPLSVKGGGHGVGGAAVVDAGLMVDLSPMKGVRVDPEQRTARAQGGVLWGELDHETQMFGLATVGGIVTHTGIAGLTLGGGLGWLQRRHGLTIDNVVSFDLVTANGEILVVEENSDPDLFWALRGGGGNFGVVTSFEYQLHPVSDVLAGPLVWPIESAEEILAAHRDSILDASNDLMTTVVLRHVPPSPLFPAELHGRLVCMVVACWLGEEDEGRAALKPLFDAAEPLADLVTVKPYSEHQRTFDAAVPHGWHYYWKTAEFDEMSDSIVSVIAESSREISSKWSYNIIFQMGGAVQDVDESATAYPSRTASYNLNINGVWLPDEDIGPRETGWAKSTYDAVSHEATGQYVNFLDDADQSRVRATYGDAKYQRLAEIKAKHDPENIFRMNHNIEPAS